MGRPSARLAETEGLNAALLVALQMRERPDERQAGVLDTRASILIVNYNGGEKLRRCLESVERCRPADCEIIVVDNASTDGSLEVVTALFSDIIFLQSGANRGFGAASNLAARDAQGRYLVFLNPDTQVELGWLDGLLGPLELDAGIGLTTACVLLSESPGVINTCGNAMHLTGLTLCRRIGRPRDTVLHHEEVPAVSGAAFAIRREVFEALGGFDEDFFLYMEDTDLSLRSRLAGWRCVVAPDSIVFHDYSLRITPRKVFYQERNRYLMLLKCLKAGSLAALLPALLLAEAMTWGFVLLKDRANILNKLKAYYWTAANWRLIMRKRRETQALRVVTDREMLQLFGFRLDFEQAGRDGWSRIAHMVFDPLFFILRIAALALVR